VLLHGVAADRHQLEVFWGVEADILAVDLPGHGDSKAPAGSVLKAAVNEIKALLKALGIKQYVLLGYSLGGFIALELLKNSLKPQGVILVSTAHSLPRKSLLRRIDVKKMMPLAERYKPFAEKLLDTYRRLRGQGQVVVENRLDLQATLSYLEELQDIDYLNACTACVCPALVIHGTGDMLVQPQQGEELAAALNHCEALYVKGADHINILNDARTLSVISDFMKRFNSDR
jgi:3-oxoadipate enol-lactonase